MRTHVLAYPWRAILAGLLTVVGLVAAVPHLIYFQAGKHNVTGIVRDGTASTKAERTGTRSKGSIEQGNPLWAIPLSSLSATRNRPIFSPTRRRRWPIQNSSALPSLANAPPVALVGAIAGQDEGVAIFLNKTTKKAIRLKMGETHLGWTLRRVKGREVTLQHGNKSVILELPSPPASRN
jgi:hypothetical protein